MPLTEEMKAKKETDETRMSKRDIDGVKARRMTIRGQMTLPDRGVAELYGVATREINRAVRNDLSHERQFPQDGDFVMAV